jgi:hypothetical protein
MNEPVDRTRTKTPMRNMAEPESNLDSSKRDVMVSPTIPVSRLHNLQAMSPRPFSVSQSLGDDFMLKCPRDSSNAFNGLISCDTDEVVRLRKLVGRQKLIFKGQIEGERLC